MRASTVTLTTASAATMIVMGWQAGTAPLPPVEIAEAAVDAGAATMPSPSPSASPSASPSPSAAAEPEPEPKPEPQGPSGTFVGPRVDTRYGVMQVQLKITDGRIVDVQPLLVGRGDSESVRINRRAIPTLEARVISAQDWNVSYVSGASYTSSGILQSVKGAMRKAGI